MHSNFFNGLQHITIIIYIDVQFIPNLVSGSPFQLDPGSFGYVPIILEHLLALWHRIFQHHLVIPSSKPWNQPFLPYSGKWCLEIKTWTSYVPPSIGELLLPNPLSGQSWGAHTSVCTSFTFMIISLSAYWKPSVYTNTWFFTQIPI